MPFSFTFWSQGLNIAPHPQKDYFFIQQFCSSLVPHEMREVDIVCICKMFSMQVTCCVCFFSVLRVFLERDYFAKSVLLSLCVHTRCLMAASCVLCWGQSQGHILDGGGVRTLYIKWKTIVASLEWSCYWKVACSNCMCKQKEGEKRRENGSSA